MAKKWFKFRNKPQFMNVLVGIIMLALYGLVGTKLLSAIASSMNCTTTPFSEGYSLLGFGTGTADTATWNCTAAGSPITSGGTALDGTVSSAGLIGVLFIVASAAVIITAFVQLNFN